MKLDPLLEVFKALEKKTGAARNAKLLRNREVEWKHFQSALITSRRIAALDLFI